MVVFHRYVSLQEGTQPKFPTVGHCCVSQLIAVIATAVPFPGSGHGAHSRLTTYTCAGTISNPVLVGLLHNSWLMLFTPVEDDTKVNHLISWIIHWTSYLSGANMSSCTAFYHLWGAFEASPTWHLEELFRQILWPSLFGGMFPTNRIGCTSTICTSTISRL